MTIYYSKNGISDGKVTYTYDKLGNIISINENGKQRSKYAFDAIGRLVSEKTLTIIKRYVTIMTVKETSKQNGCLAKP